jgi:hypothetical protein
MGQQIWPERDREEGNSMEMTTIALLAVVFALCHTSVVTALITFNHAGYAVLWCLAVLAALIISIRDQKHKN